MQNEPSAAVAVKKGKKKPEEIGAAVAKEIPAVKPAETVAPKPSEVPIKTFTERMMDNFGFRS